MRQELKRHESLRRVVNDDVVERQVANNFSAVNKITSELLLLIRQPWKDLFDAIN